nr:unnamed protein product [Spirometra erinaceieuropaei]
MQLASNQKKEANDVIEQLTSFLSNSCPILLPKLIAKASAAGLPFAERLVVSSLSPLSKTGDLPDTNQPITSNMSQKKPTNYRLSTKLRSSLQSQGVGALASIAKIQNLPKFLLDVGHLALKFSFFDVTDGCIEALEKYTRENNVKARSFDDNLKYSDNMDHFAIRLNSRNCSSNEVSNEELESAVRLRRSMYLTYFNTSKEPLEVRLQFLDRALRSLPRTQIRRKLLITLIIGRAQLDQSVESLMYLLKKENQMQMVHFGVNSLKTRPCD